MSKNRDLGSFFWYPYRCRIRSFICSRKGSETRKQLKAKLNDLIAKAKETDVEELRTNLEAKIEEIRIELEELDKEKVLKMAKKKQPN